MPPEAEARLAVLPADGVWRVARRGALLRPSTISPGDASLPTGGNRFDIPGAGVLYCATQLQGCFAETLARFRPSASERLTRLAFADAKEQGLMLPGSVPAEWRESRIAVRVRCGDDLAFVDVDHPATHTFLTNELAAGLKAIGMERLDLAIVHGPDRRLSRLIAAWAYQPKGAMEGYAGIRYGSRLGPWECWAIFADVPIEQIEQRPIDESAPELIEIANSFGLHVY